MANLTLLEAAKGMGDREIFRQGVIETFVESNRLFELMPFRSIIGGHDGILLEAELPTTSTRGVNEGYTRSFGRIDEIVQALKIYGGEIGIDPFIIETKGEVQATRQQQLMIKSVANNWLLDFFKGDDGAQPRDIAGLQTRLSGANIVANNGLNEAMSMLKLDEAIARTHKPTHLLMGREMSLIFTQAHRLTATGVGGTNIQYGKDQFGRQIQMYNGLEIVVVTDAADADVVLPFTETGDTTSIYVCSFGSTGIEGIQSSPIQVRNLGEDNTSPRIDTRMEWYSNFQIGHPRSVTRFSNIENIPAVA